MNPSRSRQRLLILVVLAAVLAGAAVVRARQATAGRPTQALTVIAPDGQRQLAASQVGDQLMVALEDLAPLFSLTVREDPISGGLSITTARGRRVLLTPGQPLASAEGRLVSLPAPLTREGGRWLVPVEFLSRALSLVADTRIDVRRASRLVIVGDVRVPRVDVRHQEVGGMARLTLSVSPRTGHQIVVEPNRLLVQFEAAALDATLPAIPAGPVLQGLRIGDPKSTIVVDLGPRFGSYRASATTRDASSEVVIHLSPAAATPPPTAPPSPTPIPAPLPPVASATVASVRTVVIDAGHGGEEPGAAGAADAAEKEITLGIARRLRAALEGRLGMRVLMTREGDKAVSLDERAALANTNKANLFISLHTNASVRRATRGAQVYYSSAGQTGEEARRAALAGQWLPTAGGSREVELILWEMAQVRHLGESAAFATIVEEELRSRLTLNSRPVLRAPFRVLAAANMPAVLVEVGFLSNPEEAALLKTAKHQDTISQALLQSIVRFRDLVERGGVSASIGKTDGAPEGAPHDNGAPPHESGAPPRESGTPEGAPYGREPGR